MSARAVQLMRSSARGCTARLRREPFGQNFSRRLSSGGPGEAGSPGKGDSSVNPDEVEKFGRLASSWWDPAGPNAMLHLMNPARVGYIRQRLADCPPPTPAPSRGTARALEGLSLLDIGCGGGFASESFARLGADVLGVDATPESIEVARRHAEDTGLVGPDSAASGYKLRYECGTVEALAEASPRPQYDVVTVLDVIEHVNEPANFLGTCLTLVRPGGSLFVSTINRTPLSYALAIASAEYVLRIVPPGTHDWDKFVTTDELSDMVGHYSDYQKLNNVDPAPPATDAAVEDITGMVYDPFRNRWGLYPNQTQVNYIAHIVAIGE